MEQDKKRGYTYFNFQIEVIVVLVHSHWQEPFVEIPSKLIIFLDITHDLSKRFT